MKKLLTLVIAALMAVTCCFGLTACGGGDVVNPYDGIVKVDSVSELKVGLICLHDNNSTYDKNFIDAFEVACEEAGISESNMLIKTNIPESIACYEAAAELVDQGCDYIFANSFGHEPYILKAANEFPQVQFSHATGTTAHTEERGNFHNAFASIYEGRYLAGVAAGMKLAEMVAADATIANTDGEIQIGYVGAFPYAEVISGYTSWFLGVRFALEGITGGTYTPVMEVQYTGSWYDETAEKSAAENLISRGAKLISQHADSMGAPTACETAGVPNVSYNGSTAAACPDTFIVSSRIDWAPYYTYCFEQLLAGEEIDLDWTGTIETGSVVLTDLGSAAAEGTEEVLVAIKDMLTGESADGAIIKIFDLDAFTVNGEKLADDTKADVDTDAAFTPDTEVIKSATISVYDPVEDRPMGKTIYYYAESEFRSAPYFDKIIDGITILTDAE